MNNDNAPTAEPVAQGEADELIDAYDDAVRRQRESGFQPPAAQQAARACVEHNRNRLHKALAAQPRAVPDAKAMAYRFMGWRLPDDFRPDCGISFDPESLKHWPGIWPVGTNLFTADQAEQMFRYVLAAAPSPGESLQADECTCSDISFGRICSKHNRWNV